MTERIRSATTVHAIADCVIAELATQGARAALVFCNGAGEPITWIGSTAFARDEVAAYMDGGFRDDVCFAHVRSTFVAAARGTLWIAPIIGDAGVIGMLRVVIAGEPSWHDFITIAAHISIRLALLGFGNDDVRGLDALTPRQREVAELVAHGCTNIEIARMLDISSNAVKKHVSRVLALLEVTNRTELAALTGRWREGAVTWRMPTGPDQLLPPDVHVVLRKPAKPVAPARRAGGRVVGRMTATRVA